LEEIEIFDSLGYKGKEIDNYTEKQIEFIIKYLFENDFWKEQISSMEKFRKKNKS